MKRIRRLVREAIEHSPEGEARTLKRLTLGFGLDDESANVDQYRSVSVSDSEVGRRGTTAPAGAFRPRAGHIGRVDVRLHAKLSLALPSTPAATTIARLAVRSLDVLCNSQCGEDLDLLTSEVVTNALKHAPVRAANTVSLEARVFEEVVRVEVTDQGSGFDPPSPGPPGELRQNGWGLFFVEQIARSWGVESPPSTVWFEVAR